MTSNIHKKIEAFNKNLDFKYSAIIQSPKINFEYNKNVKVRSASLIKLFIMAYLFDQASKEEIILDQLIEEKNDVNIVDGGIYSLLTSVNSIQDLIIYMITVSDNMATNILIEYCGMNNINKFIKKNNFNNTQLNRKMMAIDKIEKGIDNYTSASDIYNLLKCVYMHNIFNENLCSLFLKILEHQQDKRMAGYYLTDEVKFAHKTADMNQINHNVGIFVEYKTFVILMTWDCKNNFNSRKWMSEIAATLEKFIQEV